MSEKKYVYGTKFQSEELNITCKTNYEMTYDQAVKFSRMKFKEMKECGFEFNPFYVYPLTTKENWKNGTINFCPRCGEWLENDFSNIANFECHDCEADIFVNIEVHDGIPE